MQGLWLIAFLVQWAIVLMLAVLVIGILRYLASVKERWNLAIPAITKYELQQRIDDFELPDVAGMIVKSTNLLTRSGAIILVVTATCQSCTVLLAQVSEIASRRETALAKPVILIVLGPKDSTERLLDTYPGLTSSDQVIALIDEQGVAVRKFGVDAVPTGFIVDHEGRMLSQTSNPHLTNWLYTVTKTSLPKEPIVTGLVSRRVPSAF